MKDPFPVMLDQPEPKTIASGISYWLVAFFAFPFMIALFSSDSSQQLYGAWMDMGYHLINFAVVIMAFFRYLKESFLAVQLDVKKFWKTVAIGTFAVVALKVLLFNLSLVSNSELFFNTAFGSLLTTESDLAYFSTALVGEEPVWGTLCVVLLTPLTTCCLLYACVFAPICNRKPWLAYVIVAVAFLIIQQLKILTLWSSDQQLVTFFLQLPVHLIACWAYQYTDTIWTPVAIHTCSNLFMSVVSMLYMDVL